MKEVTISIGKPSYLGELYPKYDRQAHILEIGSQIVRPWPYGIDINAGIIFDIDENYMLANIDLLRRKSLWQRVSKLLRPSVYTPGVILLTPESIKHKSFHVQFTVTTNQNTSQVLISFGEESSATSWIELSSKCFAKVERDQLKGFFIELSD